MNLVMTGSGRFAELQGTAERNAFDDGQLAALLAAGRAAVHELTAIQKTAIESA